MNRLSGRVSRIIIVVFVSMMAYFPSNADAISLVDNGFESGDFTGWNVFNTENGVASVVNSFDTCSDAGCSSPLTYYPPEGEWFAALRAGDNISGNNNVTSITMDVSLLAGSGTISGYAAFDGRDYDGYDDSAIITITKEGVGPTYIPWFQTIALVGDYGTTPWVQWSWVAPTTGNYTISMGVFNDADGAYPSWALFDGFTAVPEPSTLLLLGSALLGFGIFRRKKTV